MFYQANNLQHLTGNRLVDIWCLDRIIAKVELSK